MGAFKELAIKLGETHCTKEATMRILDTKGVVIDRSNKLFEGLVKKLTKMGFKKGDDIQLNVEVSHGRVKKNNYSRMGK